MPAGRPSRVAEVQQFVLGYLPTGSKELVPAAVIEREAEKRQIGDRLLRKVKTSLGIESAHDGYGSPWFWRYILPETAVVDEPEEVEPEEDDEPELSIAQRAVLVEQTRERSKALVDSVLWTTEPHKLVDQATEFELTTMIDRVEKHLLGIPKTKDAWVVKTFTKENCMGARWVGPEYTGHFVHDQPTTQIVTKTTLSDVPVVGVRPGEVGKGMEGVEVERVSVSDGYAPHSEAEKAKWAAWLERAKWRLNELEKAAELVAISATS